MNDDNNIIDNFYVDLRAGCCPLYGGTQTVAFPTDESIRSEASNTDVL